MIAATPIDVTPEASERTRPAKRRKAPVHEVRVVVEIQMPQWMQQQYLQPPQFRVQPIQMPAEIRADMQQIVPEFVFTQQSVPDQPPTVTDSRNVIPDDSPVYVSPVESGPNETLVDLYRAHLEPAELLKNEPRTVRADISRIQRFQNWLDSCALRNTTPLRAYLQCFQDSKDLLFDYSRFIRQQEAGSSSATVTQALNAIMKLCRWAMENGRLKKLPRYPTKGDVNMMRIDVDDCEFRGEPVTIPELKRMLMPDVLDGCEWPQLGNVPPAKFWETVLLSHYCLGFRSQDWFAARTTGKQGLLWSDVLTDPTCPRLEDLQNEFGWVWYLVHKTKKKSQRAAKPVKLLAPLPRKLRESIELFRGIHPERVFPLPCNGRYWSEQVQGILLRAGFDDASRKAAKKPSIELSLGQKAVASFRKGCAAMWASHVSESAASYMLQHSVQDGKAVSVITREHYLQVYRPLREIVPALETLPLW
jgi:hypothetical protein